MIRTIPVTEGTQPYNWHTDSKYQCTWYSFYRALEEGLSAPCYWDRQTMTGSYTNAKEWLKNFREPWEVKGIDYDPVHGDIAVFDGEYGHVQFLESEVMFSEYSNGDPNSFRNGKFEKKSSLLGFLHYSGKVIELVERNTSVDQIQTTDMSLRIRTKPNINAEVVGYVKLGYYNVLDSKEADGYTWYKLASDRWCANVSTIYLPSDDTDIIRELEKYFNSMKDNVNKLTSENKKIKNDMKKIKEISEVWI